MVKVNPEKKDLTPGFSAPPDVFRSMNLKVGDIFENKYGTTVKIEPTSFSDKLQVQAMEDTELEKTTESILTDKHGFDFEEGIHFKKQYHPPETAKSYSIDFAFPVLRLAVEPHGSYLWELNDGDEAEKERDLNEVGWDVLWFDENDLEHPGIVEDELRKKINSIIEAMKFREDGYQLIKSVPSSREVFEYDLTETVEKAGLADEASVVVYDGRLVPQPVANIHLKL